MKLTESTLRSIVRQELKRVLSENVNPEVMNFVKPISANLKFISADYVKYDEFSPVELKIEYNLKGSTGSFEEVISSSIIGNLDAILSQIAENNAEHLFYNALDEQTSDKLFDLQYEMPEEEKNKFFKDIMRNVMGGEFINALASTAKRAQEEEVEEEEMEGSDFF